MSKKTVLITGASSGIGKDTAKLFHGKGWNVIATMRTPDKEEELTQLRAVLVTRLDVREQASIDATVREGLDRFGHIDVLVNNAGYGGLGQLEQFSDESIFRIFDTNVFGAMRVTRAVLPIMRKRREGRIINVSSGSGLMGLPNMSVYCATKFALKGMSEALAYDMRPFNIQVKVVAPGAFATGWSDRMDIPAGAGDQEIQRHAQRVFTHLNENVFKSLGHDDNELADPRTAAEKIFECATSDTPVHNVVGKDIERLAAMMDSLPREEFIGQMSQIFLPPAVDQAGDGGEP